MTRPRPETLLAVLAELDRIRALVVDLIELDVPQLRPEPPGDAVGTERTLYELLLTARRALLGNPAGAKGLHDLLIAEGRRYAGSPDGAQLRDALVASEAVAHLRRIWETVSLNVLDGPASPSGVPDAWAELLVDAVTAGGLDDVVLGRLRPEGLA